MNAHGKRTGWTVGAIIALVALCGASMSWTWSEVKAYVDTSVAAHPTLKSMNKTLTAVACDVAWMKGVMEGKQQAQKAEPRTNFPKP